MIVCNYEPTRSVVAIRRVVVCVATIIFILVLSSCSTTETPAPNPTAVLERIAGHWVDSAIYDSPTISACLLWPFERYFYPQGMMMQGGAWPLSAFIIGGTGMPGLIYPLGIRYLDDGLVELTVDMAGPVYCQLKLFYHDQSAPEDPYSYCFCQRTGRYGWDLSNFYDHVIIIDTSGSTVDKMSYYIGGYPHTMVRFCGENNAVRSRYYYEPLENGVRVRYFAGMLVFPRFFDEIWIYRSKEEGYRGERIISYASYEWDDSIFYEFIDTTAQPGQIYFYSIWPSHEWTGQEEPLFFGDRWQIVVTQ